MKMSKDIILLPMLTWFWTGFVFNAFVVVEISGFWSVANKLLVTKEIKNKHCILN